MPHTPLPPSLGGLQAVFQLSSGLLESGEGGGHRPDCFLVLPPPRPLWVPEQLLGRPYPVNNTFPPPREGKREEESQTCWEARTTCQHEEQTGPRTKCGLSYQGEGVGIVNAVCRLRNSTNHRRLNQICSSWAPVCGTAGPAQGRPRERLLFGFLVDLAGAWGIGRLLTTLPHQPASQVVLKAPGVSAWSKLPSGFQAPFLTNSGGW